MVSDGVADARAHHPPRGPDMACARLNKTRVPDSPKPPPVRACPGLFSFAGVRRPSYHAPQGRARQSERPTAPRAVGLAHPRSAGTPHPGSPPTRGPPFVLACSGLFSFAQCHRDGRRLSGSLRSAKAATIRRRELDIGWGHRRWPEARPAHWSGPPGLCSSTRPDGPVESQALKPGEYAC